jgi:hypothetical protein
MLELRRTAQDQRSIPWERYEELIGTPDAGASGRFPDFLVIAPPKTGTTWLHRNLAQHPRIYVPPHKETRFFDLHWRSRDINWYLAQFAACDGRIVGDVSPSYAFLPSFAIRLIREINPRLKLIVLLREPVVRTWSHVRHAFVYGEPPFTYTQGAFDEVPRAKFVEAFLDDHAASGNDYKDILSRWLHYFDGSQFHVEYIENVEQDPERYLTDVYRFLEVGKDVAPNLRQARARHNVGVKRSLPPWAEDFLTEVYGQTRIDTEHYVSMTFARRSPWPGIDYHRPCRPVRILHTIDGRQVFLHRGRFHALPAAATEAQDDSAISKHIEGCVAGGGCSCHRFVSEVIGSDDDDHDRRELSASDQRLLRVLSGLIRSEEVGARIGPRLIYSVNDYNIFQWRGAVFGLPKDVELPSCIKDPADLVRDRPYGFVSAATFDDVESRLSSRALAAVTRAAKNALATRLRKTRMAGLARSLGLLR